MRIKKEKGAPSRTYKSEQSKADLYDFPGGTASSRSGAKHCMQRDEAIFGGEPYDPDFDDWRITKVQDSADRPDGDYLY